MAAIRLANAAKHYKEMPHQLAAWNALEATLAPEQLQTFGDLYRVAPEAKQAIFWPSSSFTYKITDNVTYGEIAQQSEARRFVAQHQCNTAVVLAKFVQKARDHFDRPAIITSGYRPAKINAQVGGASRSEHLYDAKDTGAVFLGLRGAQRLHPHRDAPRATPHTLGLLTATLDARL